MIAFLKKRWKWCLWGLLVVASLIGFWLLCRGDKSTIAALDSQNAASRWGTADKEYAQATVFLAENNGVPAEAIPGIRLAVENAMQAGGAAAETYPWLYAFSRTGTGVLQNGIASSNVEITMISGDYFKIHPLPVRSGWYLDESEIMRDRIILDRQTAWDLFYSDNVVGQFLEWNGQRYMVAAVVDTEPGKYNDMAAEGTQRAWVFGDSPGADPEGAYTCVEMVLPQPVAGFAVSVMQSVLESYLPEGPAIVDNTGRFSLINRWNALRTISTRWMDFGNHAPYYENAARLVENHLALRLIPEGLLLGFPAVSVIIWLLMLNRKRTWGLHSITDAVERAVEKKKTRDYEARLRGEDPKKKKRSGKGISLPKRRHRSRGSVDFSSKKYGTTKRRK